MLLADRFLQCGGDWFDIATAERVEVVVQPAGSRRAQIEWAERCAMLSLLRHPLLRPLIDFGAASSSSLFEAFAVREPLHGSPSSISRVVTHGTRFLAAHGIALSARHADTIVRRVSSDESTVYGRPLGLALQERQAWTALAELIAAHGPRSRLVHVCGAPRMGLRTLHVVIARLARAAGYIPVCPAALRLWGALHDALAGRHVCLLIPGDAMPARTAAATLLIRAAIDHPSRHLCVVTERTVNRRTGAIHLDPMGTTAMASMMYLDPDYGPSERELFEAARRAAGAPGHFLEHLRGMPFDTHTPLFMVHESAVPYHTSNEQPGSEPSSKENGRHDRKRSRIGSVLWRASSRAAALDARGRHAAAARLLTRAARALHGRGEPARAAECWLQLAWLARNRGALDRANDCARRASGAGATVETQLRAGCLLALCLTDALRFAEAEASLRDLASAAETMENAGLRHLCQLALARVRLSTGHADRARDLSDLTKSQDDEIGCAAFGAMAKAALAEGDLATAMQAARSSLGRLPPQAPARLRAASHRVMAEALCQAGDLAQVRLHVGHGLRAATAARLPLHVLKLRAVLVVALRSCGGDRAEADRLTARIARARRRRLPPLVDRFLASQLAPPLSFRPVGAGRSRRDLARQAPFETFMDEIHRAATDLEGLGRVLAALCTTIDAAAAVVIARDGRVCAAAGKPWRDRCGPANEALTSGRGVPTSVERQPPEAAEPIRCGGELLGVIACRWIAGASVDPLEAADVLRAAALSLATQLRSILDEAPSPPPSIWGDLLGESALAASLRDDIHRAARAPFPVLIEGESGSGKELVARALHRLSARHTRRFCAINCAALSDELLEAELFGHARGAFTGAMTERAGLFEEADGGTLLLDEVGELSARAQAKLLRVLQEGEVRRVGENLPRRVDVRVVAATNRRLEREAASGRFRADLRFRLDVLRIQVPPLRERVGDIALLAQHFWKQAAARVGSHATLGPDALAALARYDWPGNVRELQNAIAWMAVHAPRRGRVGAAVLPAQLATTPMATGSSFELAREEFERRYVKAALAQAGGHRVAAAKALGISRQGLAKMLRRLRIEEGTGAWTE